MLPKRFMPATTFSKLCQVFLLTYFQARSLGCMLPVTVALERQSHISADGATKAKGRISIMVHLYHTVRLMRLAETWSSLKRWKDPGQAWLHRAGSSVSKLEYSGHSQ
jgi:hypothetical protein